MIKTCYRVSILATIGSGLFFFKDCVGPMGQVKDFLGAADRNMPCNLAVLAGHCTARASVSGSASRKLTPEEEERMLEILEDALKQGAAGISLGLMYDPGLFADTDELRKVALSLFNLSFRLPSGLVFTGKTKCRRFHVGIFYYSVSAVLFRELSV